MQEPSHAWHYLDYLATFLGSTVAIAAIILLSHSVLGAEASMPIITSMGAAAVLLFALPHAKVSQPWPLFGGNLIGAFIGITCAMAISSTWLAATLAVSLTILSMQLARCLHPPGGASALAAVLLWPTMQQQGYAYLLDPILFDCCIIFLSALVMNYPFKWRRYPMVLTELHLYPDKTQSLDISPQYIEAAIEELKLNIDTPSEELMAIYAFAREAAGRDNKRFLQRGRKP